MFRHRSKIRLEYYEKLQRKDHQVTEIIKNYLPGMMNIQTKCHVMLTFQ